MKLLLDTHTFVWSYSDPERLSQNATKALNTPQNERFISIASIWELSIKSALGRFKLTKDAGEVLNTFLRDSKTKLLPIEYTHALAVRDLPHHHGDPFDRLLIAQAQLEGMTLVSADSDLASYKVELLW